MRKEVIIALVIGMIALIVYEVGFKSNEEAIQEGGGLTFQQVMEVEEFEESDEVGNKQGELAPDFELTTLEGETIQLSDYKGERVMLNFWATWCPPCREEMPDMQKFQDEQEVQVLAVNLTDTERTIDDVHDFFDELNLSLTTPLDEELAVANEYQVIAYPTTYMIDSNGRTQFITMGAMNYDLMVQQLETME